VPICFGHNRFKTGKQAARLAHLILHGAPVSTLPVEQADLYLRINLKTAKATGLEINEEILAVADEIIR